MIYIDVSKSNLIMYNIEELPITDICRIRSVWESLEKGKDMTYFQKYGWYEMLVNFSPIDTNDAISRLFVVKKCTTPVLIAPFWIILNTFKLFNKKGAYLLGRQSWADYLNLIYDHFDTVAFNELANYLKKKYGISNYYFDNVKESTELYNFVITKCKIKSVKSRICVALSLRSSEEEYTKSLSKNTRQNIRTAKNRCLRDSIIIDYNFCDSKQWVNECIRLREIRVKGKNIQKPKYKLFVDKVCKYKSLWIPTRHFLYGLFASLRQKLIYNFPSFNVFLTDKNASLMTAKQNDNIIAFFLYGIDRSKREIVVMSAGIDNAYQKYSPGILLMYNFICELTKNKNYQYFVVDFTRGTESYKYSLGGKEHTIFQMHFTV